MGGMAQAHDPGAGGIMGNWGHCWTFHCRVVGISNTILSNPPLPIHARQPLLWWPLFSTSQPFPAAGHLHPRHAHTARTRCTMPGVMRGGGDSDSLTGPVWDTGTGLHVGVHCTDHATECKSAVVEHGLGPRAQTFRGSLRFCIEYDSEWLKSLSGTKSGSHKSL